MQTVYIKLDSKLLFYIVHINFIYDAPYTYVHNIRAHNIVIKAV